MDHGLFVEKCGGSDSETKTLPFREMRLNGNPNGGCTGTGLKVLDPGIAFLWHGTQKGYTGL